LGEAFGKYAGCIVRHGVSGKDLSDFDAQDLEETGVQAQSHRKKILREWSELLSACRA
jgi:hypothetical protein